MIGAPQFIAAAWDDDDPEQVARYNQAREREALKTV